LLPQIYSPGRVVQLLNFSAAQLNYNIKDHRGEQGMKLKRSYFYVAVMAACLVISMGLPVWASVLYADWGAGNDSTGDGSIGNPYKTLDKCVQTLALAGTHTINLKAGTYQENTSMLGYLALNRTFTGTVTIQPTDVGGVVVVQGASHATYNVRETANNGTFVWNNIIFTARAGSTQAFSPDCAFSCAHTFNSCQFNADNAAATYGVIYTSSSLASTHTMTYNSCSFSHPNSGSGDAFQCIGGTLNTINMVMNNCTSTSAGEGVWLEGKALYVQVLGGNYSSTNSNNMALLIGRDSAPGGGAQHGLNTTGSIVKGAVVINNAGHAFEIGDGVVNTLVTDCKFSGGNYGAVYKSPGTGNVCANNYFTGGTLGCMINKSINNSVVFSGNTFENSQAYCVINTDASAVAGSNQIYRNNRFICTGTASVWNWVAAKDTGGTIIDYNLYDIRGSGNFGTIENTLGITTLAGLQAAWAGYTPSGNDTHSQIAATQSLLTYHYATGNWLYYVIRNSLGQVWNKSTFEIYSPSNWSLYALPMVEDTVGNYDYTAQWPLQVPAGQYTYSVFVRGSANVAITDTQLAAPTTYNWNGTSTYYQTGDSFARLGLPANGTHAADVAAVKSDSLAIKSKTDNLLFDGSSFVKANTQATAASLTFNQVGTVSGNVGGIAGVVLPATVPSAAQIAASLLLTPANLIATDSSGRVTLTSAEHALISNDLLGATVFGSVTVKQALGTSFGVLSNDLSRSWNASTHTATVVAYACQPGSSAADHTKPLVTQVTVYDSTNTQIVSRNTTFSNLP
jgi:hypothetical protein